MPTETIKERRDDQSLPEGRIAIPESAPSIVRDHQPHIARMAGLWGLMFLVLGVAAILLTLIRINNLLGYGWGSLFAELGVVLMLFHAASDRDEQIRRGYAGLGGLLIAAGAVLTWVRSGSYFPMGFGCLSLGLFFELAFLRLETDTFLRDSVATALGILGAVLALVGLVGGNISNAFLTYEGFFFALLGLAYLSAFLSLQGTEAPLAASAEPGLAPRSAWQRLQSHIHPYSIGLGMGLLGLLVLLVALGRSLLPGWFYTWGWLHEEPLRYFVPYGALLLALGAAYLGTAFLLCSDNALPTITRRELGVFFYSPIFYIVLLGVTVVAWLSFTFLVSLATASDPLQQSMIFEPIAWRLFFTVPLDLFAIVFLVPALTMRLFSDEKRSGTLEVLLTAPVSETTVVLGKFFAGLLFFLLTWLPWVFFVVALRIGAAANFDVYPFLSCLVAWAFIGAAFVSMGLFFSSLTENQIISFILTAAGMLGFVGVYVLHIILKQSAPSNFWVPVLHHIDFLDLWESSLKGSLISRYLVFYLSMTVFWLFLSVKVLESRKWK